MLCAVGHRSPAIFRAATGAVCVRCSRAVWFADSFGSSSIIGRCQSGLTQFHTLAASKFSKCQCSDISAFRPLRSSAGRCTSSAGLCWDPNLINFQTASGLKTMRKHDSQKLALGITSVILVIGIAAASISLMERITVCASRSDGQDTRALNANRPRARDVGVVNGILPTGPRGTSS